MNRILAIVENRKNQLNLIQWFVVKSLWQLLNPSIHSFNIIFDQGKVSIGASCKQGKFQVKTQFFLGFSVPFTHKQQPLWWKYILLSLGQKNCFNKKNFIKISRSISSLVYWHFTLQYFLWSSNLYFSVLCHAL